MALSSETIFLVRLSRGVARHGYAVEQIKSIRGVESIEHAPEIQKLKERVELLERVIYGIQHELEELKE
jgi:hypothetical protein